MNQLVNLSAASMSSMHISELVQSRHDKVKQSIERLVERGVIIQPPMGDEQSIDTMGISRSTQAYVFSGEQGKRDSIIVVAQLCPEFTARLVDRWQDLEKQVKHTNLDLHDPYTLRRALLDYTEQVIHLETQNHSLECTIDTITQTPSGVKFQQACKILNIKRQVLADWLRSHGWDRRLQKARASTHYSQERGYCETKYEEVTRVKTNGELGSYSKIEFFILPKGMQVLAKYFGKVGQL